MKKIELIGKLACMIGGIILLATFALFLPFCIITKSVPWVAWFLAATVLFSGVFLLYHGVYWSKRKEEGK